MFLLVSSLQNKSCNNLFLQKFGHEIHVHVKLNSFYCSNINNKVNIVFRAKVDGYGDIIVTTVDDDGNTLASLVDVETDSIAGVNLNDDPFVLEFFDCSDDDPLFVDSSQYSICSHYCRYYSKRYHPCPPKVRQQCTNKHKSNRSFISFHVFWIMIMLWLLGFLIASILRFLFHLMYQVVIYNYLSMIVCFRMMLMGSYILMLLKISILIWIFILVVMSNVGDFTFSSDKPLSVYWDPDQGSSELHGEKIYCHI